MYAIKKKTFIFWKFSVIYYLLFNSVSEIFQKFTKTIKRWFVFNFKLIAGLMVNENHGKLNG